MNVPAYTDLNSSVHYSNDLPLHLPASCLKLRVTGSGTTKMYEYCRQLIIERRIPLLTVFNAFTQGKTIGAIVSQYLPAGIGSQRFIELLRPFETMYINIDAHDDYRSTKVHVKDSITRLHKFMDGLSSNKAKRRGVPRVSVKNRCVQILTDFIAKYRHDWKKKMLSVGLPILSYQCAKSMMVEANMDRILLQELYPEEFAKDPLVKEAFIKPKPGKPAAARLAHSTCSQTITVTFN